MDAISGLTNLGTDVKAVILVFIACLILWQLAKVLMKNPGIAGIGAVILIVGLVYWVANGGGLTQIATAIGTLWSDYMTPKK